MQYFFQHRFCLKQYVVVPESKCLKTQSSHVVAALLVVVNCCLFCVLAPIKLDDQAYFNADKVRKIATDGVLATKLEIAKLSGAQPRPKQSFRIG